MFAVPNLSALVGAQRILARYSWIHRYSGDSEPFSFLSDALGALDFKMVSSFCSRCQESVQYALFAKVAQSTCIAGARMLRRIALLGQVHSPDAHCCAALNQKDSTSA